MPTNDLVSEARRFATRVGDLLNRTVTDGIRLSAVLNQQTGECRVARGISARKITAGWIPLSVGRTARAFLDVQHRLCMDDEGEYLTVVKSRYALSLTEDGERPLFRYEYERGNSRYSEGHLHVIGTFTHPSPAGTRPLPKLHFPLGGRRFRLALEDVIDFLVAEGFADARAGSAEAIAEHRAEWQQLQLRAAVRRDPETARDALAAVPLDD